MTTPKFPIITEEDLMGDPVEPDIDDDPGTYHRYDMHTRPDGEIHGSVETNDNDDDGIPDADIACWAVSFRSREDFDKRVGRSRIGISGIKVTVMLDGQELKG